MEHISSDIYSLSALVSLELRENILKTLPQSISFLIHLERLDLGANELAELVCHGNTFIPSMPYFFTEIRLLG